MMRVDRQVTFRHGTEGKNVANLELCLLAGINELAGEQALNGDER